MQNSNFSEKIRKRALGNEVSVRIVALMLCFFVLDLNVTMFFFVNKYIAAKSRNLALIESSIITK